MFVSQRRHMMRSHFSFSCKQSTFYSNISPSTLLCVACYKTDPHMCTYMRLLWVWSGVTSGLSQVSHQSKRIASIFIRHTEWTRNSNATVIQTLFYALIFSHPTREKWKWSYSFLLFVETLISLTCSMFCIVSRLKNVLIKQNILSHSNQIGSIEDGNLLNTHVLQFPKPSMRECRKSITACSLYVYYTYTQHSSPPRIFNGNAIRLKLKNASNI